LRPRTAHKVTERRYRQNLNSQIVELAAKLPTIRERFLRAVDIGESEHYARGPSKAEVLAAAIAHIDNLESSCADMDLLVVSLQTQLQDMTKLVRCETCPIMYAF
jgi:hypothetical protein